MRSILAAMAVVAVASPALAGEILPDEKLDTVTAGFDPIRVYVYASGTTSARSSISIAADGTVTTLRVIDGVVQP